MYIETSRPRKEGDQARLVSPFFNVAPKNPYGITNPPAYCFGFFYHMYGKHIGKIQSSYASLSLVYNNKPQCCSWKSSAVEKIILIYIHCSIGNGIDEEYNYHSLLEESVTVLCFWLLKQQSETQIA